MYYATSPKPLSSVFNLWGRFLPIDFFFFFFFFFFQIGLYKYPEDGGKQNPGAYIGCQKVGCDVAYTDPLEHLNVKAWSTSKNIKR